MLAVICDAIRLCACIELHVHLQIVYIPKCVYEQTITMWCSYTGGILVNILVKHITYTIYITYCMCSRFTATPIIVGTWINFKYIYYIYII